MDGQTNGQTDDGQSDPYVSLCFAGDTKIGKCANMHVSIDTTAVWTFCIDCKNSQQHIYSELYVLWLPFLPGEYSALYTCCSGFSISSSPIVAMNDNLF